MSLQYNKIKKYRAIKRKNFWNEKLKTFITYFYRYGNPGTLPRPQPPTTTRHDKGGKLFIIRITQFPHIRDIYFIIKIEYIVNNYYKCHHPVVKLKMN